MTRTAYYSDSLVPAWLANDSGYRAALSQYLRACLTLQGYEIVAPVTVRPQPDALPVPVGMVILRAETEVEEFDVEVGDG
ncbi:hypothetical protein ACFWPV_09875 [Streptomyces uncialis]|uniref:hypothetical protein n=1 Tax=Streptomyces uncialis TaxID=1048205 RepID=UPI00365746D9